MNFRRETLAEILMRRPTRRMRLGNARNSFNINRELRIVQGAELSMCWCFVLAFFIVNKKQFLCQNIRSVVSQGYHCVAERTTSCFSHHLLPPRRGDFLNDIKLFTLHAALFSSEGDLFPPRERKFIAPVKVKSFPRVLSRKEKFFSASPWAANCDWMDVINVTFREMKMN